MKETIQTRLDEQTQAALDRLVRSHGWTTSKIVREGIRLVEKHHPPQMRRKLIGIGMHDSGVSDLAANKKYMDDFGKKRVERPRSKPVRSSAK